MSLTRILCQCCGNPMAWCMCTTGSMTGADGIPHPLRCTHKPIPSKEPEMTRDERVEVLTDHIVCELNPEVRTRAEYDTPYATRMARNLLANPQAHIDALVAAGVLQKCAVVWGLDPIMDGYRVVQPEPPHEHEWYVPGTSSTAQILVLRCRGCDEIQFVPNKLPIEVPS